MLSIKELTEQELPYLVDYWLHNDPEYLKGMGVDLHKLPSEKDLRSRLRHQINLPSVEKASLCYIWMDQGKAIGHSNANQIVFGEKAFMHLHLWTASKRRKGLGSSFVQMTIPRFFQELELKELFCEPYAHNPAPNKTLKKLGFDFIKTHMKIPGSLNFEQQVNRWRIDAEGIQSFPQ